MADLRIGISGWTYPGWRGVFYPAGLAHRRELEYASGLMRSIEINGSFYSLQRPSSFEKWYEQTPDDFVFAVKGGRFITHMKKLLNVETALANFFASGVLRLGKKLGPVLWQFPPQLSLIPDRFRTFLELLPKTHAEAAKLAERTSIPLLDRVWTEAVHEGTIRHAFEIRHPSFMTSEFMDLLASYNAAFVQADTAGKWPYAEDLTADFVYVRLHGAQQLYTSGYSDEELDWWAGRIRSWSRGRDPRRATKVLTSRADHRSRDVYVYFDNDAKVHAPFDALRLVERLAR